MNRSSKLKIALYLAAIFLAGAVTGSFLSFTLGRRFLFGPPRQEQMAERWCTELRSRLQLTPEQLQRITPIVNDTLVQIRTLLTDQLTVAVSNSNARIAGELTPGQKVIFEQMVREHQELIRKGLGGKTEGATHAP